MNCFGPYSTYRPWKRAAERLRRHRLFELRSRQLCEPVAVRRWGARHGAAIEEGADQSGDAGFALLVVTVTITALALIVGATLAATRSRLRDAYDNLERARMDAATDGAIATVAFGYANGDSQDRPATTKLSIGGISIQVAVRPETGKIALNTASSATLAQLLRAVGITSKRAAALADAIVDWRDDDDIALPNGAEAAEYRAAERSDGPGNRAFQSSDELATVLGASRALARCVAPDISVFASSPTADAAYATPRVRQVLGLTDAAEPSDAVLAVQPGTLLQVTLRAALAQADPRSRDVIVRFTGNAEDPIWLLKSAPVLDAAESAEACRALRQSTSS